VQNGSLNKSANELGVTPSAVSQSLQKLESALGVQLFERRRNGLELTKQGEILFNDIYKHVMGLELSAYKVKTGNILNSKIVIAASHVLTKYFVLNNLKTFKGHDIAINNYLSNHDQIKAVENDEADFAIVKDFAQSFKDNVMVSKIADLNFVFFYNTKMLNQEELKNLSDIDIALKVVETRVRRKSIEELNLIINKFNNEISLGHDELIIEYVKNNKAIGFAPKEYLTKEFEILDLGFENKVGINLVFKPNNLAAKKYLSLFKG